MNGRVMASVLALAHAATALFAQIPVRGRVVAAENGQPLGGASVFAIRSARSAETDRHGRFVLWLRVIPDTLVARFIGRAADTLVVRDTAPGDVQLRLTIAAVPLAGVVVQGEPGQRDAAAGAATWALPRDAVAAVPAAIEGDVFRGLALSPAVAFSTPFSSQPFVRGADPGAVGYRLDGFTVINPFHLGRIFSALMPQAIQSATLAAAPFDAEYGDATSAVIDGRLREGGDEVRGGAQASFVSAAAWAGGPARSHRWFLAWRHGFVEHVGGPLRDVPYHFNDVYGRFTLAAPWGGPVHVTAFWSNDGIFNRETGQGVGWSNALVGARVPLSLGRAGRVEIWGETSGFHENVVQLPIRGANTDVTNRFTTSAAGARLQWTRAQSALTFGAEVRQRRMSNQIEGGDRSAPSSEVAGLVGAAVAGLEHHAGSFALRLGLRLDANREIWAWQPRLRAGAEVGRGWSVGVAAGRTARLYHIIAEVLPEVEDILSVYDLWQPAGRDGIPLSTADHALIEVKRTRSNVSLRASAFASRLRGVGEVRRSILEASDGAFFRFGRGRVWGLDAEVGISGARRSLALSYVLSWSRRAWDVPDAPEIPWRYDRRHQARAFASLLVGRGWRINLLGDLASSDPITPALGTVEVATLQPGGTLNRGRGFAPTRLVLGPENSWRGGWMGHLDLGLQKQIGGPGRSTGRLGISVLNLAFTPVAPAAPDIKYDVQLGVTRVIYRPRIFLPPIPTLTLSLDF